MPDWDSNLIPADGAQSATWDGGLTPIQASPSTSTQSQSSQQQPVDNRILADQPGYTYGNMLPFKKNNQTGAVSGAFPEIIRSPVRGFQDMQMAAQNQSTDMTPDAVNTVIAIAPAAQLRFGMNSEIAPTNLPSIFTDQGSGSKLPPKLQTYTPEQYQMAINNSYEQAIKSKNDFYNFMNQSANGQTVNIGPAIQPAKDIITQIKDNPFYTAQAGRLKNFVNQYEDNPVMPVADAVDMKHDINGLFNPNKFDQGKNSPYFQIGDILGSRINQAAEANPVFGAAKTLADKNYINNYAQPFTENDLLKPFWQPEDYRAQKSVESGMAESLPEETQGRARTMMDNIKTPEQLNSLSKILPSEMAQSLRQTKLEQISKGPLSYRAKEAWNMIGNPGSIGQHAANVFMGPQYTAQEQAIRSAAQQPGPTLNPTYQQSLDILKNYPSYNSNGGYQ